jgi:hypothetical protein
MLMDVTCSYLDTIAIKESFYRRTQINYKVEERFQVRAQFVCATNYRLQTIEAETASMNDQNKLFVLSASRFCRHDSSNSHKPSNRGSPTVMRLANFLGTHRPGSE